jgi:hypothetical protein
MEHHSARVSEIHSAIDRGDRKFIVSNHINFWVIYHNWAKLLNPRLWETILAFTLIGIRDKLVVKKMVDLWPLFRTSWPYSIRTAHLLQVPGL